VNEINFANLGLYVALNDGPYRRLFLLKRHFLDSYLQLLYLNKQLGYIHIHTCSF